MLQSHVFAVTQSGQTKHCLKRGTFVLSFSPIRLEGESERRGIHWGAVCNFTIRCHYILYTGLLRLTVSKINLVGIT